MKQIEELHEEEFIEYNKVKIAEKEFKEITTKTITHWLYLNMKSIPIKTNTKTIPATKYSKPYVNLVFSFANSLTIFSSLTTFLSVS